jgi:hypothetical protein
MSFQITALDIEQFKPLFSMTPQQLSAHNIVEQTAREGGGYPCRVSLQDASAGEKLLLVNFEHLPVDSPYRSKHAIYIRRNALTARLANNEIPQQLRTRILSVRGFDKDDMMVEAEVCAGKELESAIHSALANPAVEYLHLHYAKPGCYAARVDLV